MSKDVVEVSVDLLDEATRILLSHLRAVAGSSVSLDQDYYWSIPAESRYNVYTEPSDLTIGQLSECLENLENMTENPSSAISYALVWVGDLLKAVGEAIVE